MTVSVMVVSLVWPFLSLNWMVLSGLYNHLMCSASVYLMKFGPGAWGELNLQSKTICKFPAGTEQGNGIMLVTVTSAA